MYRIIPRDEDEPYSLIIDGLHAEYPTLAVTEYLHTYFLDPKVERLYHPGTQILNGRAKVAHKGTKMHIRNFLYVGPNMTVKVTGQSHMPLEEFKVRCSKCLEENHMIYSCKNQVRCSKCGQHGHHRKECNEEMKEREEPEEQTKQGEEKKNDEKNPTKTKNKPEEKTRTPPQENERKEQNTNKKRLAQSPQSPQSPQQAAGKETRPEKKDERRRWTLGERNGKSDGR